jgi:hypothetical protein
MTDDEKDDLPLVEEAKLECSSGPVRRGMASLRGVKRTTYLRRSVLRVLVMAPEERAAFNPRNGFEEIAKALVDAPKRGGKEGAVVISAFREIRDILGERIGSNWKETMEHAKGQPDIINDLPKPEPKDLN